LGGAALVLALFGYPLYALLTPAAAEDGSGATVIFRAGLLVIFGLAFLSGPRRRGYRIGPLWPMYIFLILYTFRLIDNFYIQKFVWRATPSVTFGILLGAVFAPILLLAPLLPLRSFKALAIPMGFGCVLLLAGILHNQDAIRSPELFYGRVGTEKLNPISLGAISTSMALFVLLWRSHVWWSTLLRYALVAGLLGVAMLTQSRGPLLGVAISLLFLFFAADGSVRRNFYQFLLIGGAVALIGGASVIVDYVSTGVARFQYDEQGMDDSALGRVLAWSASWDQFKETPIFGDKVFEPTQMQYPHNIFIESLISLGISGSIFLIIHIYIMFISIIHIFRNKQSRIDEVIIALLAVKEFVQVQFSGAIWGNAGFWTASAFAIAVWSAQRRATQARRVSLERDRNPSILMNEQRGLV
jgi:O-antigen ligase